MQDFQNALITHINNSGLTLNTIKVYSGDMEATDKGILRLRDPLPACYILFQTGSPRPLNDENNLDAFAIFDIIIITESKTFDPETKMTTNLQAVTDLATHIIDNYHWTYDDEKYYLDQEQELEIDTIHQDNRHTAIAITAKFRRA